MTAAIRALTPGWSAIGDHPGPPLPTQTNPDNPLDIAGLTAYHSPRVPRREGKMGKEIDLLRGTLDMLILKAVSLGPQHGYGVLLRIQQLAKGNLQIEQ